MARSLEFNGITAEKLYDDLVKQGASQVDAAIVVSGWIYEVLGKSKRTFSYRQAFPPTVTSCVANFNRTFSHQDWVDGESIVQAQQSAGEDGFNVRFHRIESDLDAIRTDLVRAFSCLAEMRASLRNVLDEIRAELNRLNNDVYTCCNKNEVDPTGPILKNPKFMGVTKFAEQDVSLWKTDAGTYVLPVPKTMGIDPVTHERIRRAGTFGRLLEENRTIRKTFPGEVTRRDLVERFGGTTSREGRPLRDLVSILPSDAKFASLDAMVDELADREAAALRTTAGGDAAIAVAFGLDSEVQKVEAAPIERMATVPADARTILSRTEMTVGKLASAKPAEIVRALNAEGITGYSTGDVAEWSAQARVFSRIR